MRKKIVSLLASKWFYYLLALPPGIIGPLFIYKMISVQLFFALALLMPLVYYPILVDMRLEALGIERSKSIWKKIFVDPWKNYKSLHLD
jgi:hypothetical protein